MDRLTDGPTWWTWSRDWLALKWPQWSGDSRRTGVESLVLLAQLMVRERAPAPPAALADWLRQVGYPPHSPSYTATAPATPLKWLERWSIPLADIDPSLLERVLRSTSTRADGAPTVAAVARRRRNTLGTVLRAAVRRGLLATNPMDRVEWRATAQSLSLDVSTVPSPDDVRAIVDLVGTMPPGAGRYAALFAAVGMVGMHRPLCTTFATQPTIMLRARVPPAEVARRLGHSVDVLMRVYAGVFDDERERSNDLIDEALRPHTGP